MTKSLKKLEDQTLPESENMEGINSLPDEEFENEGIMPLEGLNFKPLKVREPKTRKKTKNKIKIQVGELDEPEPVTEPNAEPEPNPESNQNPEPNPEPEPIPVPRGSENKKFITEVFPKEIKIFQDKNG